MYLDLDLSHGGLNMNAKIISPMVSPELDFIAGRSDVFYDFSERYKNGDVRKTLLSRVNEIAWNNIEEILDFAKEQITITMRGQRRFDWTKSYYYWEYSSQIYRARGKGRSVGSIGVSVEPEMGPRLVGWITPRFGGRAGRINLLHTMKKSSKRPYTLSLSSDNEKIYPPDDWGHSIVWFDEKLKQNTKWDDLKTELRREVKLLFRAAPPELR